MDLEIEYKKWLSRSYKTFAENLRFTIKAFNSYEFILSSKYEIALKWFCDKIIAESEKDITALNWELIIEFMKLNFLPGLVTIETKRAVVDVWIKIATVGRNDSIQNINKILLHLCEHNSYQDLFKFSYETYCNLMRVLLKNYEKFINLSEISVETESIFFGGVIKNLTNFVKGLPNVEDFKKIFEKILLQPLMEAFITLRAKNLKYFDEVLEILKVICFHDDDVNETLKKCLDFPLHINLQYMEFCVVHHRGHSSYFPQLFTLIFEELQNKKKYMKPNLRLKIISHVFDFLRKHNVQLNVASESMKEVSKKVQIIINENYESNLKEVLDVVCSVIKLNPIILVYDIFDIMTNCMLTKKKENDYKKFEEFLILVIEMFKKLNRAETFVSHLLKSLKERLKVIKVSKKLKRKLKTDVENDKSPATKKMKIDENEESLNLSSKSVEKDGADNEDYDDEISRTYLKIIRDEIEMPEKNMVPERNMMPENNIESRDIFRKLPWSNISFAWPSETIGKIFSKFISRLMSKPSLVIWKTLIFSLSEVVDNLQTAEKSDENLLFNIDFISALFCQYLYGSQLLDTSDQFWNEINQNRVLTYNVLQKFGRTLLNFEHSNRLMNTFLYICHHMSVFDLTFFYYCPDSIRNTLLIESEEFQKCVRNFYSFLSKDEWDLIEQRIINFGNLDCKIAIDGFYMQKLKLRLLFSEKLFTFVVYPKIFLLSSSLSDIDQVKAIFDPLTGENCWLIPYLNKNEQLKLSELISKDPICFSELFLKQFLDNDEFLEMVILNAYKQLASCFDSKKSILKSINFDDLLSNVDNADDERSKEIKEIATKICERKGMYFIKKCSEDEIERILKILTSLSIQFCNVETKSLVLVLHLALYRDLIAAKNKTVIEMCTKFFEILLHFEPLIGIFNYFSIEDLLSFFPPSTSTTFYECVFGSFISMGENVKQCLPKIIKHLTTIKEFDENYLKLIVILIESVSRQIYQNKYDRMRKCKKDLKEIISIFINIVNKYFATSKKQSDIIRNKRIDKEFVLETLPAYSIYFLFLLSNVKNKDDIDEDVRRISKIYIGYSIDCNNLYAIKLMNIALTYRHILHFDFDEIEFVLNEYWNQLRKGFMDKSIHEENIEKVICLIVKHKDNDDFQKMLIKLNEISKENVEYTCLILSQIAKCQLNTIKGAIFNEYYKQIISKIIPALKHNDDNNTLNDYSKLLCILDCQEAICRNNKIPMSIYLLDDILCFLMNISIKKFIIKDDNVEIFFRLLIRMSDICLALIKFRNAMLSDRVPQFISIFKDLLQSLCWYKSDRGNNIELSISELENLEGLALKLENFTHLLCAENTNIKKLAPSLLLFTIDLMTSNLKPTTLHLKIKMKVESICRVLLSACDYHIEGFILRISNDGAKQVYATIKKDYEKYKFKGKV